MERSSEDQKGARKTNNKGTKNKKQKESKSFLFFFAKKKKLFVNYFSTWFCQYDAIPEVPRGWNF